MIPKPIKQPCPKCDPSGRSSKLPRGKIPTYDPKTARESGSKTCPVCVGSGEIDAIVIPTGV